MTSSLSTSLDRAIRDELDGYPALADGAIDAVVARVMHQLAKHDAMHAKSAAARLRTAIRDVLVDSARYPQLALPKRQIERLVEALKASKT